MNAMKRHIPFARTVVGKREVRAVTEVLKSGWLTTGPQVREFEREFAEFCGAKYAVAVNSCTAALHLALVAIGIKPGDEVIIPTMTFTATAEVVTYLGAIPIFADCDPHTFLLQAEEIQKKITPRTKAVIPVHYGGQACDISKILAVARKNRLKVVWDAAHSFPTLYKGKNIGSYGDITCFSFYATKTISTGEGGMLLTHQKKYAERARVASLHGMSKNAWNRYTSKGSWHYDIIMPGFKYNLTDIAAALGRAQLSQSELFKRKRERIARKYQTAFKDLPEIKVLDEVSYGTHAWHLFVIRLERKKLKISREDFIGALTEKGIGTSVHFIPLHLHSYWKNTYKLKRTDFPHMSKAFEEIISLPIHPLLSPQETDEIIRAVKDIVVHSRK
jgi:perosamine synthetase